MAQANQTFADLPEEAALYLSGSETIEAAEALAQEFGLSDEAVEMLSDLAERMALGEVALLELPQLFQKEFGLEESKAKQVAAKFAAVQLLPIAGVIGDVEGAIRSWGANGVVASEKPQTVVYGLKDASAAAQEFSEEVYFAEQDRVLRDRLATVAQKYFSGELERAEFEAFATKSQKIGGLGLEGEDVQDLLMRVEEQKKYVRTRKEKDLPPVILSPKGEESLERSFAVAQDDKKPFSKPDVFFKDDEAELKKMQSFVKDLAKSVKPEAVDAAGIAKTIADAAGLAFDSQAQERFAQVVDSRLRGVRDAYAARARLEDPKEKGGLGIIGAPLAQVMTLLEKAAQEVAGKKSDRKPIPLRAVAPPAMKTPPSAVGGSASGGSPTLLKEGNEAVKRAVAQVALSPASVITQKSARPKVEDIRFAARLTGPVEEIGNLGIVEFRRLHTQPDQAVQKVQDKFELLSSQGYDRKIAGVKAWRASPLYRAYSSISQQALSGGKNIEEILAAGKGKDALTREEFHAIAKLNGMIKY